MGLSRLLEITPVIGVTWYNEPGVRAFGVLLAALLLAAAGDFLTRQTLGRIASRTESTMDDEMVDILRRPIAVTCILVGLWYAYVCLKEGVAEDVPRVWRALLISVGIIVWSKVAMVAGRIFLFNAQRQKGRRRLIAKRLLPIFDMGLKIAVFGLAVYYVMLAWGIDVSGWIASAGILGVAVGFAAQETLGNIMSGIAIIADAPYKLGDWLLLENGMRGRVTDIGLRSTRIITMDEVQLIVPNSIMGNSIVTNESGGPSERLRLQLPVGVAYGSDLEEVKETILGVVAAADGVIHDEPGRTPGVKFVEFGDSSLNLMLQLWLPSPAGRPRLVDLLNTEIYNALNEKGIEIPFQTHSVYVHQVEDGG